MIVKVGAVVFEISDEKDLELFKKLLDWDMFWDAVKRRQESKKVEEPPAPKTEEVNEVDDIKSEEKIPDGFIDAGFFHYKVDEDEGVLRIRTKYMRRVFDYEKIKELFEKLPEEAVVEDVMNIAKELGMNVDKGTAYMLMHFFSRYIDFDAELIKGGKGRRNRTKLVKQKTSLGEEIRKKLEIEKDVIGTPWSPGE